MAEQTTPMVKLVLSESWWWTKWLVKGELGLLGSWRETERRDFSPKSFSPDLSRHVICQGSDDRKQTNARTTRQNQQRRRRPIR